MLSLRMAARVRDSNLMQHSISLTSPYAYVTLRRRAADSVDDNVAGCYTQCAAEQQVAAGCRDASENGGLHNISESDFKILHVLGLFKNSMQVVCVYMRFSSHFELSLSSSMFPWAVEAISGDH